MPKATKPRTTKARSGPLKATDANTNKPPNSKATGKAIKASGKASGKAIEKTTEKAADKTTEKTTKKDDPVESYLLLVRISDTSDPVITRLLSVPSHYTFEKLSRVLQIAFGWAGCHAYSFDIYKTLEEGERPNWLTGHGGNVLSLLINDEDADVYPHPERIKKMSDYKLSDIYDGDEYRGKVAAVYTYDHGDTWEHDIAFLGRADPSLRKVMHIPDELEVVCLGGEGHPCAEDSGGPGGWEDLKKAFKRRGDADGRKDWYKTICANGDRKGLDPWKWDILDVNDALAAVFSPNYKGD